MSIIFRLIQPHDGHFEFQPMFSANMNANRTYYVVTLLINRKFGIFMSKHKPKPTSWWSFRISDFHPPLVIYDMYSYLAIFFSNMKTIALILQLPWWLTCKFVIFQRKWSPSGHLGFFRFLPISFPAYLSLIPTLALNIKSSVMTTKP
jgi:hypothetical protein